MGESFWGVEGDVGEVVFVMPGGELDFRGEDFGHEGEGGAGFEETDEEFEFSEGMMEMLEDFGGGDEVVG